MFLRSLSGKIILPKFQQVSALRFDSGWKRFLFKFPSKFRDVYTKIALKTHRKKILGLVSSISEVSSNETTNSLDFHLAF